MIRWCPNIAAFNDLIYTGTRDSESFAIEASARTFVMQITAGPETIISTFQDRPPPPSQCDEDIEGWRIELVVEEAGTVNSTTLTFGVDPAGTDGVDASLCEVVQSPLPPAGNWDARFSDNGGLLIDIRTDAEDTAHTLPLSYQRVSGGTVILTWDESRVAAATVGNGGTAARLQDQFGGVPGIDVDMTTTDTLTIGNPAISALNLTFDSVDDSGSVPQILTRWYSLRCRSRSPAACRSRSLSVPRAVGA